MPDLDPIAEIRSMIERVDELVKHASNRKDPGQAHHAAGLLVDQAMWQADELPDGPVRDDLIVQIGRRRDDLNVLLLAESLGVAPPDGGQQPAHLPQPDERTLRRAAAERVPPDQRLVRSFPVLHVGRVPKVDLATWHFTATGLVAGHRVRWSWSQLQALPRSTVVADFHCVTGWSRLDNRWEGVRFRDLAEAAGVRPEATHAIVLGANAYSANLDLATLLRDEVLLAWAHDGAPLTAQHGAPLRLVVPSRYGWKSVKWVEGVKFLDRDVAGYWEMRGYHNVADPWLSQRHALPEDGSA